MAKLHERKCIIPRRPSVWWYVEGRRAFANYPSTIIRKSWRVGNYASRTALEASRDGE